MFTNEQRKKDRVYQMLEFLICFDSELHCFHLKFGAANMLVKGDRVHICGCQGGDI